MKKIISVVLSILIIIPISVSVFSNGYEQSKNAVTKKEAYQFAKEIKEMNASKYDVKNRLIVSSNKSIDYLDAVDVASGIDGLYVLQFSNSNAVNKAFDYYNSLPYVNYAECDFSQESVSCGVEDELDFVPECYGTINSNIDDAITLLKKERSNLPEIKVGVIDSGIAITDITKNRLDGGYSFLEDYSVDGTTDTFGHGTMVAGTIILNTTDNVRLRSYQILDAGDKGSVSDCVSAIYLAVSDGCKVINCSIGYHPSEKPQAMIDAVDYANEQGCVVVVGAGNDSKTLEKSNCYPASISSAITVGSVDEYDSITSFSNFGNGVDVYAPGVNIASYNKSGEKAYDSGTSASATIVSAIASLLLSYNENLTTSEIETLLSENGKSVYQSTNLKNNVIADAYEMMKSISGSELEQLELDYDMSFNDSSIYTNISFKSNDENAKIYYRLCKGLYLISPTSESSLYENGTTINLDRYQTICAYAFAPGKAKSKIEYIMAPINYYEEDFLMEPAGELQQYNTISRCQLKQSVIEIPNEINGYTVEKIGKYCFIGNKDVETIVLPETVVEIDDYAFANCPNLKTVIAPGVDTCGMYAFYDCDSLINVEMPNLTYANTGLFKNCISLEIAKLGTLTEIDNHAFYGCKSLLEINSDIQNEQWAVNTFYNCDSLICPASKHNYKYKSCSNDMVLYECIDCKSTTTRSVEYLQISWRNSIINQKQSNNLFDSYLQFDVVPDGIINAKDFAKIKSSH